MSKPYGPFTLSAGVLQPVITNQYPDTATVVIINESPFTLKIDPGTGSYYVVSAFTQDKIVLGNQYSGLLNVTPIADINTSGEAPATVLYIQSYAYGETVPGSYPAGLTRMTNVGNAVVQAQEIVNLNGIALAPIISANEKPDGTHTYVATMNNDGSSSFGEGLPTVFQVSWDNVGNLTATQSVTTAALKSRAPVNLLSGFQETGKCGDSYTNAAAGATMGPTTNFKCVMTNTPTSITLNTPSENVNANAPAPSDIDVYGFWLAWSAPGAGTSRYVSTYTTVGN